MGFGTSVNEIADLLYKKIDPSIRPIHTEEQSGELRYSIADIRLIANDLKYHHTGSLADKINEVIEHYEQKRIGQIYNFHVK